MNNNPSTNFHIEDPEIKPLIFVPDDSEINWSTDPLPAPRAKYKRNVDDIGDNETGMTSDWNFVLPN